VSILYTLFITTLRGYLVSVKRRQPILRYSHNDAVFIRIYSERFHVYSDLVAKFPCMFRFN